MTRLAEAMMQFVFVLAYEFLYGSKSPVPQSDEGLVWPPFVFEEAPHEKSV